MKNIIQSVKGTRDFYPAEMALRNWLYSNIKEVSESFGYEEFDGPYIEKVELYAAKSGEELVREQSFVFPDRSGEMITLRPELTPSLARLVAQRQHQLNYPLRWWSFGPFWRYERPQKGRTREFFQWNIDLIGVKSPESDAELVAISAAFLKRVGLKPDQAGIFVNDRSLMETQLAALGVTTGYQKKQVFRLVDRRDKLQPADWDGYAIDIGLNPDQLRGLKALLDNLDLWKESKDLQRFFASLDALGVRDYVHFNPQIIRGLDYYTGIVFEARSMDREGRAILGGGRYDNLVGDVGGEPVPGTGFAMGDVMIAVALEKFGLLPTFRTSPVQVLVTVFDDERMSYSLKFAHRLREAGFKVACFTDAAKLPKQFKHADKIGARIVAIIGPEEQAAGMVTLKDLYKSQQQTVPESEASAAIQKMLAQA